MERSQRSIAALLMVMLCVAAGCGDEPSSSSAENDVGAQGRSSASREDSIVVTLHFSGGDARRIRQLKVALEEFGTVREAKVEPVTRRAWCLMKPGVGEEWAEREREMLRGQFFEPLEYRMSTWAWNEGDWFGQIE